VIRGVENITAVAIVLAQVAEGHHCPLDGGPYPGEFKKCLMKPAYKEVLNLFGPSFVKYEDGMAKFHTDPDICCRRFQTE